MSIKIFYDKTGIRVDNSGGIKNFIGKVIRDENMIPGDLNFIITDNESILKINREFLSHDYYTDVISFDYSEGYLVNGEVYISYDTVKENSSRYNVDVKDELFRVMVHGLLHILGYNDDTELNRNLMFSIQEKLVGEFKNSVI